MNWDIIDAVSSTPGRDYSNKISSQVCQIEGTSSKLTMLDLGLNGRGMKSGTTIALIVSAMKRSQVFTGGLEDPLPTIHSGHMSR